VAVARQIAIQLLPLLLAVLGVGGMVALFLVVQAQLLTLAVEVGVVLLQMLAALEALVS
jgi:hypothetical protein